ILVGIIVTTVALVAGCLALVIGIALLALECAGLICLLIHGPKGRWQASWALCAASAFLVMLATVLELMPGYTRAYSLRGQVRRHAAQYEDSRTPVVCFPRRWDSVSFYLRRNDVQAFSSEELPELLAELEREPEALLFLKHGRGGYSPSCELLSR